jgi:hypothetical protein
MDDAECVQLVQSARRLSDANQLNAALTSYQTAYALRASPWLLINIGRVQQKMGRPAEAIITYRSYLNSQPDGAEGVETARGYLKQAEQDLVLLKQKERQAAQIQTQKPIYKKAWFWLAIGGSVVAASAITAGVILGTTSSQPGSDRVAPANSVYFMF